MDVTVQKQPLPFFMFDDNEEKPKKGKSSGHKAIVDFFSLEICPAGDWKDAEIIATMDDMCELFNNAYPGESYSVEEMRLALFEMNIKYERNEHNQQYYYLAKWK